MKDIKKAKKKCNSTELDISRWGHERIAEYTIEEMREKKKWRVEEIYFAGGMGIITFCILELHDWVRK